MKKKRDLAIQNQEAKKKEIALRMEKMEQLHLNDLRELNEEHNNKINYINNLMEMDKIKFNNNLQEIKTHHENNMNLLKLDYQRKKDEIDNYYYNMNPAAPSYMQIIQ